MTEKKIYFVYQILTEGGVKGESERFIACNFEESSWVYRSYQSQKNGMIIL